MGTVKVVNLRDYPVHVTPFEVDGVRVLLGAEVEVAGGGTLEVSDECAYGAHELGRGGLLEQDDNWAIAKGAANPKSAAKAKPKAKAAKGDSAPPTDPVPEAASSAESDVDDSTKEA